MTFISATYIFRVHASQLQLHLITHTTPVTNSERHCSSSRCCPIQLPNQRLYVEDFRHSGAKAPYSSSVEANSRISQNTSRALFRSTGTLLKSPCASSNQSVTCANLDCSNRIFKVESACRRYFCKHQLRLLPLSCRDRSPARRSS